MIPDGPVISGRCTACGSLKDHDIYRYLGIVLCGDCRYVARHGREPHHDARPGGGLGASHTIDDAKILYDGEWGDM